MSDKKRTIGRRNVLKTIGTGTAALSIAATPAAARERELSRRRKSGGATDILRDARDEDAFQDVLESVQSKGATVQREAAAAEELTVDGVDKRMDGAVVPLDVSGAASGIWAEIDCDASDGQTAGYLLVQRDEAGEAGEITVRAVFFAQEAGAVSSESLVSEPESVQPTVDNMTALQVVTPDETYTDRVDDSDGESVSAAGHTVEHCYFENNDPIEHADDAVTCGACLVPGEGLGIGDVAQCLWCIYQLEKAACLIGYCMEDEGGSAGDHVCGLYETIASTPLWLLPISGGQGLKLTASAVAYGCNTGKATDCTSPTEDLIW